jgi:hypothetical protein
MHQSITDLFAVLACVARGKKCRPCIQKEEKNTN